MTKNIKLNIKVLSVGSRGANILERLSFFDKQGIDRIAVGVSNKVFSSIKIKNKIELRKENNLHESQNIKAVLENVVNEKQSEIEKSIKGADALFIVGNLANNTSHYQIARISQLAKENNILTFFIGSTPFPFEGKNKIGLTNENKIYLEDNVDAILMVESQKVMKEKLSALESITKVDKLLAEMVNSVIDMVIKYGIINVDFADLKSTLQNAGEIFFNSVCGSKKEVDKLIENLFEEKELINEKKSLNKVLYVIYAGKDLLMDEVNSIGDKMQEHFNNKARVIFGVVNEDNMKNKLKIVLLGS